MPPPLRATGLAPVSRRLWPHRLVAMVLVVAGGLLSGWPVAETYTGNDNGAHELAAHVAAVASALAADPVPLRDDLTKARAYNAALSPAALHDPWGGEESAAPSAPYEAYLAELDLFDAMGRPRIPQIGVDLPIFHGATRVPLSRGVGHMYGSSLPVGGLGTHAVLAAHTGMRSRTFFDRLPELQSGQLFYVDVDGVTLTYRVDRISVVEPWQLEAVARVPGADLVTLVTCYTPPGSHQQRLLVRGARVTDAVAARAPASQPAAAPMPTAPTAAPSAAVAPGAAAVPGAAVAPGDVPAGAMVPVAADLSVQGWMVARLAVSGGALAITLLMAVPWVRGRGRARARRTPPVRAHDARPTLPLEAP